MRPGKRCANGARLRRGELPGCVGCGFVRKGQACGANLFGCIKANTRKSQLLPRQRTIGQAKRFSTTSSERENASLLRVNSERSVRTQHVVEKNSPGRHENGTDIAEGVLVSEESIGWVETRAVGLQRFCRPRYPSKARARNNEKCRRK